MTFVYPSGRSLLMRRTTWGICQIAIVCTLGCKIAEPAPTSQSRQNVPAVEPLRAAKLESNKATQMMAKVHATLRHSRFAFTQGLAFWRGRLFEGTGLYGKSSLRELDPLSGDEIRHVDLDEKYFGEGVLCWMVKFTN